MTIVSDGFLQWWMSTRVSSIHLYGYFVAASSAAVVYDWALTFGQEFELILSQRWSFMTVLYICVRYFGILYSVVNILGNFPTISMTDVGCTIIWYIQMSTPIIVNAMLGVIMIARIYAMYQGSKKLLIFLVVMLLACTIASGAVVGLLIPFSSPQEVVGFSCTTASTINMNFASMTPTTVWEIIALFLTVRIVMKHFRELRQSLTGSTAWDCFRVLVESHAFYFLAFVTVAFFSLGSIAIMITTPTGSTVYYGVWSIAEALQMFVLGPRLVLSIREHHAKVVARTNGGIGMTTIAFRAGGDVSTGSDV